MIKAYNIHKFYECKLSGAVLVEVSFALQEGFKSLLRPFSNRENAIAYLNTERRTWFLQALETYVNHKKQIIEHGNHESQKNALNICLQALEAYEKKSTEDACKGFQKGYKYFQDILPNPNNKSYQSSCETLNQINEFCEMYLKEQL